MGVKTVTTIVVLYILVAVIVSLGLRGCFFEKESFSSAIRNLMRRWRLSKVSTSY